MRVAEKLTQQNRRELEQEETTRERIACAAERLEPGAPGDEVRKRSPYGRDIIAVRKDNGPDYPWLLLLRASLRRGERGIGESAHELRASESRQNSRAEWVPVIAYDPRKGRRAFTETVRRLKS